MRELRGRGRAENYENCTFRCSALVEKLLKNPKFNQHRRWVGAISCIEFEKHPEKLGSFPS
jgi:hypothetical protein